MSWRNDHESEIAEAEAQERDIFDENIRLQAQVKDYEKALELLSHHRDCDDGWYRCPQHLDGCLNKSAGTDCDCGAKVAVEVLAKWKGKK